MTEKIPKSKLYTGDSCSRNNDFIIDKEYIEVKTTEDYDKFKKNKFHFSSTDQRWQFKRKRIILFWIYLSNSYNKLIWRHRIINENNVLDTSGMKQILPKILKFEYRLVDGGNENEKS